MRIEDPCARKPMRLIRCEADEAQTRTRPKHYATLYWSCDSIRQRAKAYWPYESADWSYGNHLHIRHRVLDPALKKAM